MTEAVHLVPTATGVDVALRIAGPGTRAFAFVLDWQFRVVLALAWYVCAALVLAIVQQRPPTLRALSGSGPGWFLGVIVPAAAIYFLYHPLLELALHGQTPGKRIAGVRVVGVDGSAARPGALLARNVFRLVDSAPALYAVGLVATIATRQHVRIGDLVAGTLLVRESSQAGLSLVAGAAQGPQHLDRHELALELLARWDGLDAGARRALAHSLLARVQAVPAGPSIDDAALRGALRDLVQQGAGP
jgi:uncharacterized RDD family membrane protein YckC